MAGYGMTDPKAAAAINALAAKNKAAAAAKPYVVPSPTAYGMNNTKAAAAINAQSLKNNVNATSSGGYGMTNVAAGNYINQLANTTAARAQQSINNSAAGNKQTGTTKTPSWNPISGMASYQLPSSFDYSSLASHFGLNNPKTAWDFGGSGSSSSGVSSGLSGLSSILSGGGSSGGLGALTSLFGGGGSSGLGGLGSMMGGGGMGGIGDALGGALGGGSGGAPAEPEKEPDKPIPQRHWAGGYTSAQQAAMNEASSNYEREKIKAGFDTTNIASFKGQESYDETKKDRVKQAQQLAERQGGAYDTEGNFYDKNAAQSATNNDSKKRAQAEANYYEIPDGAVPIAGNENDKTPPGSTPAADAKSGSDKSKSGSKLDNDWLKKLGSMAASWFGGG